MKTSISRTDNSVLGQWCWSVDRPLLIALFLLFGVGILLSFSSTPPIEARLKLEIYSLIKKQFFFLSVSTIVMLFVSMQSPRTIRRFTFLMLLGVFFLLIYVLFNGIEIKGGRRWIIIAGQSIQPSEFLKPSFAIVLAWLLALGKQYKTHKGTIVAFCLFAIFAALLIKQPDVGMTITLTAIFLSELFLSGFSLVFLSGLGFLGILGGICFYFTLPHFQARIDGFFNPKDGEDFQINTAMQAFKEGGLFGKGPGEGTIKNILPDGYTDFIMAVAAEEFGLLFCFFVVCLFGFIILRGFWLILKDKDMFSLLAVSGLLVQFGVQTLINISSTLGMIPTKGMTLPFISYGGSSLVSLGFGMGVVLALTRSTNTKKG